MEPSDDWGDLIRHAITLACKRMDGGGIRLRLHLRSEQILEGTITSDKEWFAFIFSGCPTMEDVVVTDSEPGEPSWAERYEAITRLDPWA